jgi:hypothetical protein
MIFIKNKQKMKKIVRLTENDLSRIIKRVIREMDDNFDDDLGFGSDFNQNEYDGLLDQARQYLIDNSEGIGFDEDDIYEMSDDEVIDVIKYYDKGLYHRLEDLKYSKPVDLDEPYDSIGGFSVNDLRKAFKKTK